MTISKSWFSYLTRAFALFLCTALLLNFVSCSDSTTSQEPKVVTSTYTVKHLLQNLQDDSYTEDEEAAEQKTGTYGTQTAAVAKTFEGFTARPFEQATIQADGSTVIEIYYDRNTYTVSYSSTYGDPPESKTAKYGYVLTAADLPDLTQTNFNFNGWVYENTSIEAGYIVKTDITLTALWDEIIATYTVKHLLQNLKDDNYTEDEEAAEPKSGKSGIKTAAVAKTYEGFTAKTFEQKTIQADGSTVVEIYYDRNTYTLSYSSEYGEPPASKPVKYEYVLTAEDLPILSETGYNFNSWVYENTSIEAGYTVTRAITLTAQWEEIPKITKENFSSVIASLTEDSTIVLTGELTDSDLTALKTAIKNSTYNVNLDLSQTTGLTSIPDSAFRECRKLSGITIPDSITSIGKYTFYGCTSLSSVTIPDSVTSIGNEAFRGCTSLSSVTIPDSVTSIGYSAFILCTSLTTITVDSNNANYSSIDGVLFNKVETTLITYPAGKKSAAYTIPDSVTSIGQSAFNSCSSLSSVTIHNSVTSIDNSNFSACTSLTTITVDSNNANYSSIGGVLFNKDATAIITYPEGKKSAAYTIPNSVKSIGSSAFHGCTSLSSVTIPDSVTSIESYAFINCKSLSSVTIPDSVTSIGEGAFSYCAALSSVTIGDSVTSIGMSAFLVCSKLTSLTFKDPTTWYRTNSSTNWKNKTGGTLTDVTNPSTNVTYFKNTYSSYLWYKL